MTIKIEKNKKTFVLATKVFLDNLKRVNAKF